MQQELTCNGKKYLLELLTMERFPGVTRVDSFNISYQTQIFTLMLEKKNKFLD